MEQQEKKEEAIEELREEAFREINKHFAQSSGNVSKVSRTWALTIIVPALAWVIKDGTHPESVGSIFIIGLSLLSLLLDGVQYIYVAARSKHLLNELQNINFVRFVSEETRKSAHVSYVMIVAKFCVLMVNTVLLMLILIMKLYSICL